MASLPTILSPLFEVFNLSGLGLNMGHIWIGEENQDPEDFPKAVFWDLQGTVPATQPLDTIGGYLTNAGTPARLYTSGPFSIRVRKKSLTADPSDGELVYYLASVPNLVDTITPGAWPMPMTLGDLDDDPPITLQWLGGIPLPWAMQLPTNLTGAVGQAFFVPTATWTASLRLNSTDQDATTGTLIGTMVVATNGDFSFTTTGGVPIDLPAGSNIDWYAPLVPDLTIKGVKWTWFGYVNGDGSGAYADVATLTDLNAAVATLNATIADLTATVDALSGYDPGDVKFFAGPAANLTAKWLALGETALIKNIADYPELNDAIGTTWGGDGVTTFALPPSNRYPRGHTGTLPVGTLLDDAMQGHFHEPLGATSEIIGVNGAGNVAHSDGSTFIRDATTGGPVTDGVNGTPRTDDETRPLTAVFTIAIFAGG